MSTSTMRTTHVASAVGKLLMAVAVALAIGSIAAGPALAAEHGRGGGERRGREWRGPRVYQPCGYAYGYDCVPPPVVYAPPPPPVVYAPPPPPPGISFVFPIRIR